MNGATIAERLSIVRERIATACTRASRSPEDVTLIAVSKGFGVDAMREAIDAGITDIGENRVQEFVDKHDALANVPGVRWHMIGHLQRNKAKVAVEHFDIIHSVDSLRLAEAISNRALSNVSVFLEVNVAEEQTKAGFSLDELPKSFRQARQLHLDILGLMTVAPLTDNPEETRPVFRQLREAAHDLGLEGLSMGMTNDYEIAIEEGATHVRVGRAIFGERSA
jgi:pyridoxal phosphate enzyme (YggS family)